MAWNRPDEKPLSEPMMVSLLTHICATRPQWVNSLCHSDSIWLCISLSVNFVQVMAWCLTPPSHYLNQCQLPSMSSCGIHLRSIWREMLQLQINKMCLKTWHLKLYIHLPEDQWVNKMSSKLTHYLPHVQSLSLWFYNACISVDWFLMYWRYSRDRHWNRLEGYALESGIAEVWTEDEAHRNNNQDTCRQIKV